MITIENGVNVSIRQTKEGIVLMIQEPVETPVVVEPKKKSKAGRKKGSTGGSKVDQYGNKKWLQAIAKSGKKYSYPNPAYGREPGVAVLGQQVITE